jgi:PAS domain S-box-containing protein
MAASPQHTSAWLSEDETILATIAMPVCRVGAHGAILWANSAELELLGYAEHEYVGHNLAEFHADHASCASLIARIRSGESFANHEALVRTRAGDTRCVLVTAHVRRRSGGSLEAHLFSCDITQHRRHQRVKELFEGQLCALKARTQELEKVMSAMPVAVWVAHDRECRRVTGNRESYRMLRVREGTDLNDGAALSPRPFRVQRDGIDLPPREWPLQMAATQGVAVRDVGIDLAFEDGAVRRLFGSALPLLDHEGLPRGAVASFLDVTPLRDAIRVREDFLSIASHELKTPLMTMELYLGSLEHAVDEGGLDRIPLVDQAHRIHRALEQFRHLSSLINELFDVSRIASGRLIFRPEAVDLGRLVREVVGRFWKQAEQAGSHIAMTTESGVVGKWDKSRVDQVVTNLISNAVKYGAGRDVHLDVLRTGQVARLTVSDRGQGIAPEDRGRIFGRFERGSTVGHVGGLGLGLWIAKEIVTAHGGSIGVTSTPGLGSTFTVDLPMTSTSER